MAELIIEIPDELDFIRRVSNVDWSVLFNKLLRSKLDEISQLKVGLSKSEFTEKDVGEFSDKINESLSQRYLK